MTNKDKFLLFGFFISLAREKNIPIGASTLSLCDFIASNPNKEYGKNYSDISSCFPHYSISTVHKIFSMLIDMSIMSKEKSGNYVLDVPRAIQLINND